MFHLWVLEINRDKMGFRLTVQDTVPAIPVDLCWFMRPVPWWGDAEKPRLGRFRMEGAFTLAGPRLGWDIVVGVLRLVWLCTLRYLGRAVLGALGLIHLPVTLQCAVVMLELDVLSMKMVIFLRQSW